MKGRVALKVGRWWAHTKAALCPACAAEVTHMLMHPALLKSARAYTLDHQERKELLCHLFVPAPLQPPPPPQKPGVYLRGAHTHAMAAQQAGAMTGGSRWVVWGGGLSQSAWGPGYEGRKPWQCGDCRRVKVGVGCGVRSCHNLYEGMVQWKPLSCGKWQAGPVSGGSRWVVRGMVLQACGSVGGATHGDMRRPCRAVQGGWRSVWQVRQCGVAGGANSGATTWTGVRAQRLAAEPIGTGTGVVPYRRHGRVLSSSGWLVRVPRGRWGARDHDRDTLMQEVREGARALQVRCGLARYRSSPSPAFAFALPFLPPFHLQGLQGGGGDACRAAVPHRHHRAACHDTCHVGHVAGAARRNHRAARDAPRPHQPHPRGRRRGPDRRRAAAGEAAAAVSVPCEGHARRLDGVRSATGSVA